MKKKPMMELSTIVERETINIKSKKHPNGKVYELANVWDFGPFEEAMLNDRHALVRALLKQKKATNAQKAQLEKALGDIIKMLIPEVEIPVLAELTVAQKTAIMFGWLAKHAQDAEPGNPTERRPAASRLSGSSSSRGSKTSTAATPRGGSTSLRGR